MNLPTDILRNIVSFNNPKLEIMVKDKSRNEVTNNYLCMCNDIPLSQLARIIYTKKHFAKNDIIKVMNGNKFISYGMIIDMLHQPIPNTFTRTNNNVVAKNSYSWKLLYTPLVTEDHFINGVKTIECFKPTFKSVELSLKVYSIVNYLKESCNDIFMINIKLYDVVCCYKNINNYSNWCSNIKPSKTYLVYMGDELFVSYRDFLKPRHKYLEKLEVAKFKLEYPNTIIQHIVSKKQIVSNKDIIPCSKYEDYVERIEWIGLGIEKEAIMNVILERQSAIYHKRREDEWNKINRAWRDCPCGEKYQLFWKDLHERSDIHQKYLKEQKAFYAKLEEQQNETNYLSFDDVV